MSSIDKGIQTKGLSTKQGQRLNPTGRKEECVKDKVPKTEI